MISIKLKAKLEILYLISQANPQANKDTNKNKTLKSRNQDSLSSYSDKQNANIIYTKLENIPGFESRISEVSQEDKVEIISFLRSIDISIANNLFGVLNTNQFYEKIKNKTGILIVKNFISEIFNKINLLLNNENEMNYENENIACGINQIDNLNPVYNLSKFASNENSKALNNNITSKSKISNSNPISVANNYNTNQNNKKENLNYSQLNKNTKSNKNILSSNTKANTNLTSNLKQNFNLASQGNRDFNTNQNLISNNFSSNNPLLNNFNSNNSNNNPAYEEERFLCIAFPEIKLNDECEVFVYLDEFLNIDENDAIEIYELFKYNQNFSLNENTLFILFYMISAYESVCLEEFFNLFSEEIFEFISAEQKFISVNRLKDLARILGFNELLLMKCCRELQINPGSIGSNCVNNAGNLVIDYVKFKAFYLLLGKKFDAQMNTSVANVSNFQSKKKAGGRISSDCFSKACNIL